jgi:hypothetical protein
MLQAADPASVSALTTKSGALRLEKHPIGAFIVFP